MKRLGYFPMIYHHDKGMWPPVTSSTSYFLWQKNMWEVFQELPISVLWNMGGVNSNLYDPISKWKADNIKYTSLNIQDTFQNCDVVLVDFPSTVMWDAKKAGKPCLCLAPLTERRWVREDVLNDQRIEIQFVTIDKVKISLEIWLIGWKVVMTEQDLFVVNQNDWLKEITL